MSDITPSTFSEDTLSLEDFALKLEKFLIVEHDFVEGSLVVCLKGSFGSGKSTFLSMWKADIEERRKEDASLPIPITLNTWDSDYCEDPLLSVVMGLLDVVHKDDKNSAAEARLFEAAKDAAWFSVGIANKVVSHFTGIDAVAAGEFAEKKKKSQNKETPDFITLYKDKRHALKKLKETLVDVLGGNDVKALVFVDELDRCRPDYAIAYLETIKHVFNVHGLVFVLAIDYEQLSCSAKTLFGADLNVDEYLRKFIHRTVSLPGLHENSARNLARRYAEFYIDREEGRVSRISLQHHLGNAVDIIVAFKMTLRQIQETFRIIGHTAATDVPSQRGGIHWCIGLAVMLMSALRVKDTKTYYEIGEGRQNHLEICRYLMSRFGLSDGRAWVFIYLAGASNADEANKPEMELILRTLGFLQENESFHKESYFSDYFRGWGGRLSGRFQQIYQAIERGNSL